MIELILGIVSIVLGTVSIAIAMVISNKTEKTFRKIAADIFHRATQKDENNSQKKIVIDNKKPLIDIIKKEFRRKISFTLTAGTLARKTKNILSEDQLVVLLRRWSERGYVTFGGDGLHVDTKITFDYDKELDICADINSL